jgi:Ca-activated chloride channel family protein
MFRFEHFELLWALAGIPFFVLIFVAARYSAKRKLRKFGDLELVSGLIPEKSRFKPFLKFTLFLLAFTAIIFAAANPQIGSKPEEVKRQGIELMVALDISNSMNAEDIRPSRLERAKQSVLKLIDNLEGDRIGIVVFAGDAFRLLPMTTDYSAAKLLVSTVESDMIATQGTAIGNAIDISLASYSDKEGLGRALILISDGENHEDDAVSRAEFAAENGIQVYTIGMGTPEGGPIPITDRYGRTRGYRKDQNGQTVMTKLNPAILKQVASKGGGSFAYASNASLDLTRILNDIAGMEKEDFEDIVYTSFDDKFMYFAAIAFILLLLEPIFSFRKNKYLDALSKFASGETGGNIYDKGTQDSYTSADMFSGYRKRKK